MGWLLVCSRNLPAGNINKAKLAVNKPLSREPSSCLQMPCSELCPLISVVFCSDNRCLPLTANAATFDFLVQDIKLLCCSFGQPVKLQAHQVLLLYEQRSFTSFLCTVNITLSEYAPQQHSVQYIRAMQASTCALYHLCDAHTGVRLVQCKIHISSITTVCAAEH